MYGIKYEYNYIHDLGLEGFSEDEHTSGIFWDDFMSGQTAENNIIVKDPFFVQEAYTFIYDSLNRPVAMGKHRTNSEAEDDSDLVYADDDIMGKAITNHIRKGKTNVIVQPR